jgi:hypothetical protein
VNLVLEALEKAGMRINGLKCTFHAKEMEFLNYIIGLDGIKMNLKESIDSLRLARTTKCG